ncbi:hypothetical protein K1719_041585 [Acacia pycnantha]|nr:hypothetical protein K1719_041585 [Acacia pycnantha]
MEALRNPRFHMIGLCGLGGVGKTTIAKDIEKEEKNQKVFEKVIMATVSKDMNVGKIQDQIIEKSGMQLHETIEEVLLPKLEILELSNLLNKLTPLIWDEQLSHNSFNNLKVLVVKSCGFVKLAPLCAEIFKNLEEVEVISCDMLEIVFDFEETDSSSVVVPLKKLKLMNLPKLKNVWSDHYQGNISFPSLRSVDVYKCESLTSIFPASIAKGMLCDLKEIQITECGVDAIVAKDQVSESVVVTFGFPRSLIFIETYEEENILDSKYPLLSHDKVIGNLERLTFRGKEVEKNVRGVGDDADT